MTDLLDRLKTALADRYTIERELGRGGMATVYLAQDLKHRRQVAIKVLHPELAASLGVERFVREIEIAANLTHPHILGLHDSGEADGFLYYVMPFIEGESLRERLEREGKLSITETIRLTDQIASALSHAHERGLVHRDIKPENILLAGDQAIVADFGIARAVQVAGGERLTGTGLAIGTPAYMSPEQAMGLAEVDARSDVYALGCVVYEMVVGRAPFEGTTPQELLAKHAVDTVPALRRRDPTIPVFLERAVERALAKTPADRFASAGAFAAALTSETVMARVGRRWHPRTVAGGVVGAVLLVAAALWGLSTILAGPAYARLAVLPPTNLMNDPGQDYFVQGMHNALISELQKAGVAVIARTSVMQYENPQKPIREIARELGVDAVIEASVLRAGDSVEIQVSVVDGRTQQYVGDPIVRRGDLRNVERLYRGLTGAIAAEIQAALTPQAEARLATAREVNPAAYEAYLKGQSYVGKFSPADLETALHYFELALEHDPEYALAYAGIAWVWASRSQFGIVRPRDAAPLGKAAAERAVELDSTLAEVQYALAAIRTWHEWDWAGAGSAFERAIALNPNYPDGHALYSHFLLCMKRPDEAVRHMELAVELDPFNPLIQSFHGMLLYMVGRYDEAIAQFKMLLRTVPNNLLAHSGLQLVYHEKGMYEESLAEANALYTLMEITQAVETLALGYAEGGYRGAMSRAADTWAAFSSARYVPPVEIAQLYAFAGEDGEALDWLERGFEERDPNMPYLNAHPGLAGLRDNARFHDLRRRMNLPE
jgi:TolB-like protein/Tfp pilus assembly protein PilF